MYVVIALLAGVVLGLRFKVLVFVPVTLFVICAGGAFFSLEPTWYTFWAIVATIVALQIGYVFSLMAHSFWQHHIRPRQSAQDYWRRI